MEQKQFCCDSVYDQLPPLSTNYSWFVAQNLNAEDNTNTEVQIFFTLQDPLSHYRCRITELLGKRVRGCFYGWVILSNDLMWSLWNPTTSKIIRLPPLILKDGDSSSIGECFLSCPPNDPSSILLLTRLDDTTFVFSKLDRKRKRLRWTEMSYAKQLMNLTGEDGLIRNLTHCNGKVYAITMAGQYLVQVGIVVRDREVVISLSPLGILPRPSFLYCPNQISFLKGSFTELFIIVIGFKDMYEIVSSVHLFKLDMTSMTWEEIEDLKDKIVTIEYERFCYSVSYSSAVASELGGYIHILDKKGKIINSYHVKEKTITLSSMPCLAETNHVSAWSMLECRLEADNEDLIQKEEDKVKDIGLRSVKDDEVEFNSTPDESHLLNLPMHILEMIMEFCVGIEYLKFRATCKRCHLAAPLIKWKNEAPVKRLHTYSLVSPWHIVFDKHQRIITLTDPVFGDKYFIKTPQQLICNLRMYNSKYGWLLMQVEGGPLVFYNPFTSDIRELPLVGYLESICFSAPPTSSDCMVVGFTSYGNWHVYIHFVAREPSWHRIFLDFGGDAPFSYSFPTFNGRDLYALCKDVSVDVFTDIDNEDFFFWDVVVYTPTSCCASLGQYFPVVFDQHLLLVVMGKFGEPIEVFEYIDYTKEWEKIDDIGSLTIYICDTTCICIEAKIPKMENKIYFPRLHSGNIVFYSLETQRYHTSNGENAQENFGDFFGMKHDLTPQQWIEPSWS
ncbi:hypothetical protein CTI12_AA476140 [Artemisia annua]|uniref:F-box domain-containing protein n=1 Tax=Artemisia annua TaxID=35608 RepID=A0A2U1LM49_ARTAN|nr:hypothetical protein CTI12_AA476140 [Artemisia annua]